MGIEVSPRAQCPQCASLGRDTDKNNLAIYANGKFCQAGCGYQEKPEPIVTKSNLIAGSLVELVNRRIEYSTCEKYNVRTTEYTGKMADNDLVNELVRIFPIYKQGKVVKQKIKCVRDKKIQAQRGDTKYNGLFGQQVFSPFDRLPLIITEGEEDALAVYQMTKLPAVSITGGATASESQLLENLEWLSGWREIYLCMDNDEKGREAVELYKDIFEPGTVRSISLPLKDANEMLLAGREVEFKKCMDRAIKLKPDTIVFPSEIREKILTQAAYGSPWPWEFMTKITYGIRLGEVYMLSGAPGVGKTQMLYQILSQYISDGSSIMYIDLERQPEQTMQRILSGILGKRIYSPNCEDFHTEEIAVELDKIEDRIALFRPSSGKLSLETILINIRYLAKANNTKFFVIDNLKALSTTMSQSMKQHEFASLATGAFVHIARELNVNIFILNHLIKDNISLQADITMPEEYKYSASKEGLTWETGRMPCMDHIFGGGNVGALPDYLIVIARNCMSTDEQEQRTIRVKFLKTRFDSEFLGQVNMIRYDRATGLLSEVFRGEQ